MTRKLCFNQSSKYPFDLDKVLYTGQDFRWCKWKGDWHSGVLKGNLIHIRQVDNVLEYKSHSGADLDEMLRSYFRLNDPIDKIYDDISHRDKKVAKLIKKYPWLRVLRHPDPWECMAAYICSAPNSVGGITICVEKVAEGIGQPIELCGDERYTFPTCKEVLCAGLDRLKELELGLKRAEYIFAAAKRVCCDDSDFEELTHQRYDDVVWQLMEKRSASRKVANGIGGKVADCIALFALDKTEAFPVDRNIGRALAELYDDCPIPEKFLSGQSDKLTYKQYATVVQWAWCRFGPYAGYAGQFLFFEELQGSNSTLF